MTVAALSDTEWSRISAAVGRIADAAGGGDVSFLLDCLEKVYEDDERRRKAMDAALITVKYGGDSTVKRLWRECGYDLPRKAKA